ncbi:Uma2 family endonuclease [Parafrankia elaeagni]|uniref:Uma2 family endonuclease n=1 Tax=Parafrankia elaeagni TaxID=222534 RepID=UPI0018A803B1|nr:Uma2 family endonuclease [Parafrankia elaeagni]
MSVARDHGYGYGPYTVEDLHGLPDDGRSFELVDGWLIELAPSTRHDFLAGQLSRILERAAEAAKARVYVQAPMDIATPAGARKPDVAVIDAVAASSARRLGRSLYHGADVLLAVEVVSRGSGSEREDRGRKVTEYALAGIPQYWIVDFDPEPRVQVLRMTADGAAYGRPTVFSGQDTVEISDPFPVSFPLPALLDFS